MMVYTVDPITDHTWSVVVADDLKLYVHEVGNILITSIINDVTTTELLSNVLYVLDPKCNLISILQLMNSSLPIVFVHDYCKMITNDGRGRLLFSGQMNQGFFCMNFESQEPSSTPNVVIADSPQPLVKVAHTMPTLRC